MRDIMKKILFLSVAMICMLGCSSLFAGTITYTLSDLGSGYWQYDYLVQGVSFNQHQGFYIYFNVGAEDFTVLSTLLDWDLSVIPPDPLIPDNGWFDGNANVDNPSLLSLFSVKFKWTGLGAPGSQYFEIYDTDGVTILDQGYTRSASVPEPLTLTLLGLGLASALFARRKLGS
jgi:hypothetical protein